MTQVTDITSLYNDRSIKTIFLRGLWSVFWPFFRWLPKSLSFLRIAALRLFGAKIGEECLILPGVRVLIPWMLVMGDRVAIGRDVNIYNFKIVDISSDSVISQEAFLCTGTHDLSSVGLPLVTKPISIGRNCWIGARVNILPGVSIGEGVAIGLGSTVVRSIVESWTIYGGNPAKKLKVRKFS